MINNKLLINNLEIDIAKLKWLIEKDFIVCIQFMVDAKPVFIMQRDTEINLKNEMIFLLSEMIIAKENILNKLKTTNHENCK